MKKKKGRKWLCFHPNPMHEEEKGGLGKGGINEKEFLQF